VRHDYPARLVLTNMVVSPSARLLHAYFTVATLFGMVASVPLDVNGAAKTATLEGDSDQSVSKQYKEWSGVCHLCPSTFWRDAHIDGCTAACKKEHGDLGVWTGKFASGDGSDDEGAVDGLDGEIGCGYMELGCMALCLCELNAYTGPNPELDALSTSPPPAVAREPCKNEAFCANPLNEACDLDHPNKYTEMCKDCQACGPRKYKFVCNNEDGIYDSTSRSDCVDPEVHHHTEAASPYWKYFSLAEFGCDCLEVPVDISDQCVQDIQCNNDSDCGDGHCKSNTFSKKFPDIWSDTCDCGAADTCTQAAACQQDSDCGQSGYCGVARRTSTDEYPLGFDALNAQKSAWAEFDKNGNTTEYKTMQDEVDQLVKNATTYVESASRTCYCVAEGPPRGTCVYSPHRPAPVKWFQYAKTQSADGHLDFDASCAGD